MRCLVTGGCGFVGRHLIARLLSDGCQVDCVDPLAPLGGGLPPERWPLFSPLDYSGFRYAAEDCRVWFRAHAEDPYDAVFHLAAVVGGREVIERQPLAVAVDLAIDAEFWSWAARARPARIAAFSSSAAYPVRYQREQNYRLLREDMVSLDGAQDLGVPDMSYGWAKLTCEYLARLAHARHGLRAICFRPFSGYGEDQDAHYPFPAILRRALAQRGAPVFEVWGSGRQLRDFIHIDDGVRGILQMLDRIEDGSAVNLSTGIYTSMADLARRAAAELGWQPEIRGMCDKPEGVFARAGDTTLQRSMGFAAWIPLAEGVQMGLRFLKG